MESSARPAVTTADPRRRAVAPEVTLVPGAPRAERALAEVLLARYLARLAAQVIEGIAERREFARCCQYSSLPARHVWERVSAELDDAHVLSRRARQVRRDPRRHARLELPRLVAMMERVPFEWIALSELGLVIQVGVLPREDPSVPPEPFAVHLPLPGHPLAPVFLRPSVAPHGRTMFTLGGCHGACRGEAQPLVDACSERLDVAGLVVTSLAWARRNLT